MWYIYTGAVGEVIPLEATHVIVLAKIVPAHAFRRHPNIIEVHCHWDVKKIEEGAFFDCRNLRRVIMPGVKEVQARAFWDCEALTDVECGKLELIGYVAFFHCKSLGSINLPSARIVEDAAFHGCSALVDTKFGNKLERIGNKAFGVCSSLERLTIPLKDGIITADNTFTLCRKLKEVNLVEGEVHETIAALPLEDWRNDMNEEIDSINQILPSADAGEWDCDSKSVVSGEKSKAIGRWIRSVFGKIDHYKARHQQVMDVAATTLQLDLPQDIVRINIFPFLALPPHLLDGENYQVEVGNGDEERVGVDEHEGDEVGRGDHFEEDGQDEEREEQEVDEVGRDNHLEEELGSDHEENKVSPPRIIVMEILLFYWLVIWGSFSLMRGMPFASPVLVSALVTWQVRKR